MITSRGASGFWVENGRIAYPVEEITIAGNMKNMLRDIEAVGADISNYGAKSVGSVLVGKMKVDWQLIWLYKPVMLNQGGKIPPQA